MLSIDAIRLLALSLVLMVATTTVTWLLRSPSGIRRVVCGCMLSLGAMAAPAAVMALGPHVDAERIIGHVSAPIPAAQPYYDVPPPETARGEPMEMVIR